MFDRYGAVEKTRTVGGGDPIRTLCAGPDASRVARRLTAANPRLSTSVGTTVRGAVDALEADAVDCVVSDHRPSGFDGVALLERVRTIDDSLPVLMFTAHGTEATASAAIACDVSGYVRKGAEPDQYALLSDSVESAVSRHRETLRLSERRSGFELAETLFNNTQDALFVVDVTGEPFRLDRVNPAYEALTGLESEELRGRTLVDVFGTAEGGAILGKYRACVEAREPIEYEEEVAVPSSGPYWETRISPVVVDDRVRKLVGATRNITERKRERRELERTGEFLRQTQQVAEIGGWEVDERSGTVRWTAELYRIYGFDTEYEPTVANEIDCYHSDDRATIRAAYDRLVTEGEPYDLELRLATEDSDRWVRTRGEPWEDGDDRVGARGTLQDVTAQREREAELRRTNDRLDEFASVVSHDLRNPLLVAQGSLDLYRDSGSASDVERVVAAHDRIGALITDLLTLAREGTQVTETTEVALGEQVATAFGLLPAEDASLSLDVGEYTLRADEARLDQLLGNLLGNAVSHAGPDVTIRVGLLDGERGFYVADDGPGIPGSQREAVFRHGYSTGTEGTGLGLAIVRSIASAHGWTVAVTESADGGARFELRTE